VSNAANNPADNAEIITRYIVDEFLPDVSAADLSSDYDLLAGGVIDSLALLKVVDWLGERFQLSLDDVEFSPDDFRSVDAISAFVSSAPSSAARQ